MDSLRKDLYSLRKYIETQLEELRRQQAVTTSSGEKQVEEIVGKVGEEIVERPVEKPVEKAAEVTPVVEKPVESKPEEVVPSVGIGDKKVVPKPRSSHSDLSKKRKKSIMRNILERICLGRSVSWCWWSVWDCL